MCFIYIFFVVVVPPFALSPILFSFFSPLLMEINILQFGLHHPGQFWKYLYYVYCTFIHNWSIVSFLWVLKNEHTWCHTISSAKPLILFLPNTVFKIYSSRRIECFLNYNCCVVLCDLIIMHPSLCWWTFNYNVAVSFILHINMCPLIIILFPSFLYWKIKNLQRSWENCTIDILYKFCTIYELYICPLPGLISRQHLATFVYYLSRIFFCWTIW